MNRNDEQIGGSMRTTLRLIAGCVIVIGLIVAAVSIPVYFQALSEVSKDLPDWSNIPLAVFGSSIMSILLAGIVWLLGDIHSAVTATKASDGKASAALAKAA